MGGPSSVLFDILFLERSEESQDQILGEVSQQLSSIGIPISHAVQFRYEEQEKHIVIY